METPTLDYSKKAKEEEYKPSLFSRILSVFKKERKIPTKEEEEEEKKQRYNKSKARLQEYAKRHSIYCFEAIFNGILLGISLWFLFGFLFAGLLLAFHEPINTQETVTFYNVMFPFFLILSPVGTYSMWEASISRAWVEVLEYERTHAQDEVEEDPFQNSIKTSYKYLDRYYDQTQRQAQQGFHITVFIAIFGALLIFGGVAAMYAGFIQPAYITCASGAITELISAIFFYLYNKTVTSMSRYHNKLVLSQNISFALRVADSLENNKDAAKLEIIKELVKDVNAQMMKSDGDADGTPKKDKPPASDAETPS